MEQGVAFLYLSICWPNLDPEGKSTPALLWASPAPKQPRINLVWRMEMPLRPTEESFSAIGFKLHYTSNFMGT